MFLVGTQNNLKRTNVHVLCLVLFYFCDWGMVGEWWDQVLHSIMIASMGKRVLIAVLFVGL